MKLGTDAYQLEDDLTLFLENIRTHHWQVYHIQANQTITFHASLSHRHDILRTYPHAQILYTGGILGIGLRSMLRIERMLALLLCICLWWLLSHTIFEIDIKGDSLAHQEMLTDALEQRGLTVPFLLMDNEALKNDLWTNMKKQLNWLEITTIGSKLDVHFLGKKVVEPHVLGYDVLIAQKDGVIAAFDVTHGNKQVSLNQFVKAGEVLISPILINSMNQEQLTPVNGKVYAYTFLSLELEIKPFSSIEAFQYYEILLALRQQVSKHLTKDEYIVKEIPLQFQKKNDKIRMKNYYVLYEQIAVVGELNETE